MPLKADLEERIVDVEKQLQEAMGAIRKLAQQQNSNIELLSKHESEIASLKTELSRQELKKKPTIHDNSITRYE